MSFLKTWPLRLFLITALSFSLSGCGSATEPKSSSDPTVENTPVTIGLTYIPNIQFSPFYVAEKEHLFGDLPVTLRHHGQNEGLFTALLQGRENLVIAGADEAAKARSENQDLVVVAPYYTKFPVEIMVPHNSEIKSVSDLAGKKVGLPGQYGENWFGLQYALKQAGLKSDQVNVQSIGYTQRVALQTGSVDAVVGFRNNDAVQFQQAGYAIREIPLSSGDVPLLGAAMVTSKEFATHHPESLKRALKGVEAGILRVVADPKSALEHTTKYVPEIANQPQKDAAMATLKATLPLFPKDEAETKLDIEKVKKMLATMQDLGIVSKSVGVEQITVDLP